MRPRSRCGRAEGAESARHPTPSQQSGRDEVTQGGDADQFEDVVGEGRVSENPAGTFGGAGPPDLKPRRVPRTESIAHRTAPTRLWRTTMVTPWPGTIANMRAERVNAGIIRTNGIRPCYESPWVRAEVGE